MLNKKAIGAFVAAVTLLSGFAFASLPPVAFASTSGGGNTENSVHDDNDNIVFKNQDFKYAVLNSLKSSGIIKNSIATEVTYGQAKQVKSLDLTTYKSNTSTDFSGIENFINLESLKFDGGAFSDDSLKSIGKLTKLTKLNISGSTISGITSLDSLKSLTKLQELTIDIYLGTTTSVSDLSPLKDLTKLTKLRIPTKSVTSLDPIKSLTKLQELYLQDGNGRCKISDISKLTNFKDLEDLNIGVTKSVTSLEPLKDLTKLKNVEVWGSKFSDLSPLSEKNLDELHISEYTGSDSSVISSFTNLSFLELGRAENIKDFSFVSKFTKLKRLFLSESYVSSLEPLKNLTNLTELDISGDFSDLTPLHALTNLTRLGARGDFSDLTPLKDLTKLRTLTLSSDNLSDLSPIKNLSVLNFIYLTACSLKNIAPLSNLKALSWVSIGCCNSIENYAPLKDLPKLKNLTVNSSAQNDANIAELKKSVSDIRFENCPGFCKPKQHHINGGGSGDVPTPRSDSVNVSNVGQSAPKVPAAPKSVNDLKNEVKNKIVVGNNNVANAGVTNRVVVHVDNENFNNELKQKGYVRAYAFMYSTPKLLRGTDGSDYVTVKAGANGVISFDAKFPDGYSGKHTVVLVDQEGNQLAWTNITVKNNVKKDATTKKDSKHSLPITGVNTVLTLFVMLMFATAGGLLTTDGLLRKVR